MVLPYYRTPLHGIINSVVRCRRPVEQFEYVACT